MTETTLTIVPDELAADAVVALLRAEGIDAGHQLTETVDHRAPSGFPVTFGGDMPGSASGLRGARRVLVDDSDYDRAHNLLEASADVAPADEAPAPPDDFADGDLAIDLYDEATGERVGNIDATDLDLLLEQVVEESPEDVSFYVNTTLVDTIAGLGGSPRLVQALRRVLTDGEGDIRWSRR